MLALETQVLVEVEGTLVVFLSVDHDGVDAALLEPVETIEDQSGAESSTGRSRCDGKALKVAAITGPTGDGVTDDGTVDGGHPEPTGGCCMASLP